MALTYINQNIVNPAANAVITLTEAKKQLRIETDFTEEDDLIQSYIDAAINAAEDYIAGHIYNKAITIHYSELLASFKFEVYPVRSITSIKYYKIDEDTLTTIDAANYYLRNINKRVQEIVITTLPEDVAERPDAVEVIVQAGYADSAATPKQIKQAILLMVTDMYAYREDRKEVDTKVSNGLLRPFRNYV